MCYRLERIANTFEAHARLYADAGDWPVNPRCAYSNFMFLRFDENGLCCNRVVDVVTLDEL